MRLLNEGFLRFIKVLNKEVKESYEKRETRTRC